MTRSKGIRWSLIAWLAVAVFWLIVTRRFHPTPKLAVIVTSTLLGTYASASYVNHLALIPQYWRAGHYGKYTAVLLGMMIILTGLALTFIRISYFKALGPDPDPNGMYVHFTIDFTGMATHVAVAALVVWIVGRMGHNRPEFRRKIT